MTSPTPPSPLPQVPQEQSSQAGRAVETPQQKRRSRRVLILWAVALTLLLTAGLVCWKVVVPMLRLRAVIQEVRRDKLNRAEAVKRLGGPEASVSPLCSYLRLPRWLASEGDKHAAVDLLGECGRPGVRALLEALDDRDNPAHAYIASKLLDVGHRTEWAYPEVLAGLVNRAEDGVVADVVYKCFMLRGPNGFPSTAIPALTEALRCPRVDIRYLAAKALGEMGSSAKEAVPALVQALDDTELDVRRDAAQALGRIKDARVIRPLEKALRDKEPYVRQAAAEALKKIKAAQEKK